MENNQNDLNQEKRKTNTSTVIDNFSNDPNQVTSEVHNESYSKENNQSETSDPINEELKAAGKKDMIIGGLWLFGGLAVTIYTYTAASGGGRFFMAWGAIIFGGIQFFRGLNNYSK